MPEKSQGSWGFKTRAGSLTTDFPSLVPYCGQLRVFNRESFGGMSVAMFTLVVCSLAVGFTVATGTKHAPFDGKAYDYLVVGGGISGLVVANRLTEDRRSKSVAEGM